MLSNVFGRPVRRPVARPALELLESRCLPAAANVSTLPVVPVINFGMKARLRAELAYGAALGNHADVFSKVGDSITAAPAFLTPLGTSAFQATNATIVGGHTDLAATFDYFGAESVDDSGADSFKHTSLAAVTGWTSANVLNNHAAALAAEFSATQPALALIMVGTNDVLYEATPDAFRVRLQAVVKATLAAGVIPVLSTIPDDLQWNGAFELRVDLFNQAIADVAADLQVPLWNYWLALQNLPNKGIASDNVHPSTAPQGSWYFTTTGLKYGFNVRNFTAVEVLDKLRRVVIDDGAPDYPDVPLSAGTVQFVVGVVETLLQRTPSQADLAYWGRVVENGVPRNQVVYAIWQSAEHRGVQVAQYYATYLHRGPTAQEQAAWTTAFQAGASETQVQQAILDSSEYQGARPNDAVYIAGVYHDVLGYYPSSDVETYWEQALQAGLSRSALADLVAASGEAERQAIQALYGSFLGRFASVGEVQGWMDTAPTATGEEETVAAALVSSDEFIQHVASPAG